MAELTGQQIGPYQVLEQIGRGGMAAVYRAHNAASDEFVAIKLVAPHLSKDPNFERRFRREAEVLRKLQHPNIIPVLDHGEAGGYAYLVMPFLQVGTLTDRLRAGRLGPREGARLMEQIADALQYAHDHGVVHRDVKPSNVLLDEQGNALLSDFGMARMREPGVSMTGSMLVGTPAYMSPEQARGEKATYRSDQYSLGIILYELTTGRLPFEAESPIAVALKHINDPLPAAREASPNVPELVEQVILKATAKVPRHRFPSVAAMNLAFQDALKHSLDPTMSPAPRIELPPPVQSTMAMARDQAEPVQSIMALARDQAEPSRLRLYLTRAAGLALAVFLVLPAFSIARALRIAPGMERGLGDLNPVQMAQLNGTLQAMSTDLAGTQTGLMPAEQIQTAVAATLIAGAEPGAPTPTAERPAAQHENPTALVLTPISTTLPSSDATPTPSGTAASSATPQSSAQPLETASTTPTPSASPITPAPTSTLAPSSTPTSTPTRTPTPSATDTPLPTATQDLCQAVSLSGFATDWKTASWTVTNGNTTGRLITRIYLDWPDPPNLELRKIRLDNALIWNAGDPSPPTTVDSDWKGSHWIPAGNSSLSFEFAGNAAPLAGLYQLELELEDSCELGAGG